MACVAFRLFHYGVCRLQVISTACVAFQLAISACVAYKLFTWCVSLSGCFHGVCRLQVVSVPGASVACVAFRLAVSGVSRLHQFHGVFRILLSILCLQNVSLFVFMACVAFSLFLRRVSPSGCFHGVCRLKVVSTACVTFRLAVSGVCRFQSSIALHLVFIARVAYNLPGHVPPSSCCHGVCRLKVSSISRFRRFQTSFYNVCRSQVSSAVIARIPFRLVCLWYFLLLIQFSQCVSLSVQYLASSALIYSVCRSSLLGSFFMVCCFFCPHVRRVILVLYFTFSILCGPCFFCMRAPSHILQFVAFLFAFVVAYVFFSATSSSIRKFSSLFLCLFVNVIEVKALVFSSLFLRALLFSRLLFTWHL